RPKPVDSRLHDSARARAQGYGPLPPLGPIHPPRMMVSAADTRTATEPPAYAMQMLLAPPPPPPTTILATPSTVSPLRPYDAPTGRNSAARSTRHESRRELDLQRQL